MANEELGTKRDCPECGARFYDLKRDPAHCPKCGHEFVPELILKPRRPRPDDETAKPQKEGGSDSDEDDDDYTAENVPSLDEADQENAPAASKRKSALDDDDEEEENEDEIKDVDGLGDIDVNIDEEDDTLLDDEDDGADHLSGMVTNTGDEDER